MAAKNAKVSRLGIVFETVRPPLWTVSPWGSLLGARLGATASRIGDEAACSQLQPMRSLPSTRSSTQTSAPKPLKL